MISGLINHLWQSTLFAGAAGLLSLTMRRNRAAVRFWIWLSASLKFLLPFALLTTIGSRFEWAPAAKSVAGPAVSGVVVQIGDPFSVVPSASPVSPAPIAWIPIAAIAIWACGFAGLTLFRLRSWRTIRAAMRSSAPIGFAADVEIRESAALLEPGIVGICRPVLLLPRAIAGRLSSAQLDAVLAHELCHVRRRDNLFAALHMLVETIFWFHPLVWWIGARLVEERERACDEAVLRAGSAPAVYAEGILNVCKLYLESPLSCVSGVTGADLRKRIEAILRNRATVRLGFGKIATLALAALVALAAPLVVGMLNAPSSRAQTARKFEVASIKLSRDCGEPGASRGDVKTKGGGPGAPDPSRIHTCGTLQDLITTAYVIYANDVANRNGGRLNQPPLSGLQEWMKTERYVIDAKAEDTPGNGAMHGTMLRALLADRFRLQLHHESREVDAYDLTVKTPAKLHAFQKGTCTPRDPNLPSPPPGDGGTPCAYFFRQGKGPNLISVEAQGTSFENFAKLLAIVFARPVIDKSGLAGLFDFHVEFTPDESTPFFLKGVGPGSFDPTAANGEPPGPSIFIAMQESGLKLDPSKGARDFLVIDSAARPTGN